MFGHKQKGTIDTLVGATTRIDGDVHFKGGLRIDGHVRGNVIADPAQGSMLVVSENARIEGDVRGGHLIVNGDITGAVFCTELLELQPKARITGEVGYKVLEMHGGAVVHGKLTPEQAVEPVLKLASSKT